MTAYYNEFEPKTAAWLRELIRRNLIAPGDVDERSIVDVQPDDLRGYEQCHFFAGIGGWSCALRLAGWDDSRPVWTGSCPCQPFSTAGKQRGRADERHLWPAWFRLIRECRPGVVAGEQVACRAALDWLDHVCDDMEGAGYAIGTVDIPACSVGAPHIRQRLYWVADSDETQREAGRLSGGVRAEHVADWDAGVVVADAEGSDGRLPIRERRPQQEGSESERGREVGELADSANGGTDRTAEAVTRSNRPNDGIPWADCELVQCADGKSRPVEPGSPPLAHGLPARLVRLRGYGNAIVPQAAAQIVKAYMEIRK